MNGTTLRATAGPASSPRSLPPSTAGEGSLRRVDWRFLLPYPEQGPFEHLVLRGADGAEARLLVELEVARRVSDALPPPGTADALVVPAGAPAPDGEELAALRPGGVLCWELDRRTRAGWGWSPRRACAHLRGAGMVPLEVYSVKGHPRRPSMYLPLGGGAPAWYFEHHFTTRTLARRLLRGALRLLTGWSGARLGALAPTCVVVARRGGGEAPPPSALAVAGLSPELRGSGTRAAFLLQGEGEWSRVAILPFQEGAARPRAVVKLPRAPRFNPETEREQAALSELRGAVDAEMRRALPAPLETLRWRGLTVAVQEWVQGRSLFDPGAGPVRRSRAVEDFRLAARWLAGFQLRTALEPARWDAEASAGLVAGPIGAFTTLFATTPAEERLFAASLRRAEELSGASLPIVRCHGDFGPWNVYRDGDRVAVIDWEGVRSGPPLGDLLYLAMHWSWTVRRLGSERARQVDLVRLFVPPDGGDRLARVAREEVAAYLERLRVPAGFFPLLLVRTLVEHALERATRLRDCGDGRAARREDNPYAGCVAAVAYHTERLFGGDPGGRVPR